MSCRRCLLDDSVPGLDLDAQGLCAWCRDYDFQSAARRPAPEQLVASIRAAGRGRPYDCVMGLSGGVDSSYAVLMAHRLGLRPLVVHVDNGWNTAFAVLNIESLLKTLQLPLDSWIIEWEEFRAIQLAFLRAGVVDLEMPSDHAILAGLFRTALRYGVKYILTGDNYATEATLPPEWNHPKTDLRNLRAIYQGPLRTFPTLSTLRMLWWQRWRGLTYVPFLSYLPYSKAEARRELQEAVGWRDYGGKHHESIITRFYQGYILPRKFGIDKRRFHLSRLICSGQLTREEALSELARPHYDEHVMNQDRDYVIKKFGLTEAEFEGLMAQPPRSHYAYPSDRSYLRVLFAVKAALRRLGLVRR